MADGRVIRKKTAIDKRLNLCSEWEQVIFYRMIPFQDDYGRLTGNLYELRLMIYPACKRPEEDWEKGLKGLDENLLILYIPDIATQLLGWEKNKPGYFNTIGHRRQNSEYPDIIKMILAGAIEHHSAEHLRKNEVFMAKIKDIQGETPLFSVAKQNDIVKEPKDTTPVTVNKETKASESNPNAPSLDSVRSKQVKEEMQKVMGIKNLSNPGQYVVEMYKLIKHPEMRDWSPEEIKAWDKENFARYKKGAESLLRMCIGRLDYALGLVEYSKYYMEEKGFEWTFETVIKRFADIKINYDKKIKALEAVKKKEEPKTEDEEIVSEEDQKKIASQVKDFLNKKKRIPKENE